MGTLALQSADNGRGSGPKKASRRRLTYGSGGRASRPKRGQDAPHDAKEEAMLLDEAWGEIHAAYENGAARLYRCARPTQPAVFVGVEGGLADYTAFGPVRVALVDWDAIRDACDDEEALERIAEYREEIAALPDGDFKAGLVAALDELERRHRGEPKQTALEIAAG